MNNIIFNCFSWILLLFFVARLGGHLSDKAREANPFEKYTSMRHFYLREVLFGLFLQGQIISAPWFIFKETEDKRLKTLYLIVNVLTVIHYLLIVAIIAFAHFYREWL